jgi:hypothetical protein
MMWERSGAAKAEADAFEGGRGAEGRGQRPVHDPAHTVVDLQRGVCGGIVR